MPGVAFQAWKAPRVESGELSQTIRDERKRQPIRAGDTLKLCEGARTNRWRSLGWATCTAADRILVLGFFRRASGGGWRIQARAWVAGKKLTERELEALAVADGFSDGMAGLLDWLRQNKRGALHCGRLLYEGVLIKWGPTRAPDKGTT